jgi:hypothetical protein
MIFEIFFLSRWSISANVSNVVRNVQKVYESYFVTQISTYFGEFRCKNNPNIRNLIAHSQFFSLSPIQEYLFINLLPVGVYLLSLLLSKSIINHLLAYVIIYYALTFQKVTQ